MPDTVLCAFYASVSTFTTTSEGGWCYLHGPAERTEVERGSHLALDHKAYEWRDRDSNPDLPDAKPGLLAVTFGCSELHRAGHSSSSHGTLNVHWLRVSGFLQ